MSDYIQSVNERVGALLRTKRNKHLLFEASAEYDEWSDEQKHIYQNRLGAIVGTGPVTRAAWIMATDEANMSLTNGAKVN